LATTHPKVANSGSGKTVIARYRIRFFSKKSCALAIATGKLARYCPALQALKRRAEKTIKGQH